jgi:predicted metalloendopeptidase
MKIFTHVSLCLSIVCAASVVAASDPAGEENAATGSRLTSEQIAADVLGAMDRSADPCVDFYQYACGTWVANTEIPPDQPYWVRSFSALREQNREVIRELIEGAAATGTDDPVERLIGTYYGACMDTEAVEKAGVTPLAPLFQKIATVEDLNSLFRVTGELYRTGIGSLFGIGFFEDLQDPDSNVAHLVQGGLGLPDRDYYVSDDAKKQDLLAE